MKKADYFLSQLEKYAPFEPIDEMYASLFSSFAQSETKIFSRENVRAHITSSAVVVNEDFDAMLLMHHKKLNIWLQFGGHADGNSDLLSVAKKELEEESGIIDFHVYSEDIFDLEIHQIPQRKNEPEHLHFDVRFLFVVDNDVSFKVNKDEALDIRWFSLDGVRNLEKCWLDRVIRKVEAVGDKKYLV